MGRKCFVRGCNSGQPSCKEKVSLFSAPSDPKLLEAWARAIPRRDRAISSKDAVCRKHFADDMILKKRYFAELGGKILLDVPKRVALAQGAVPSIFPPFPARPFPASKKRKHPATRCPPPLPKARKKYKRAEATVLLEEEPEVLSVQEDTACTETSEIGILPFREADAVGTDDQTNQTAAEETTSVLEKPEVLEVQEEKNEVLCYAACSDTSETSKQTFREADVVRTDDQTAAKETTSMLVEPEVCPVQEEKGEVSCDTACSDTSETLRQTFGETHTAGADDDTAARTVAESQESIESNGPSQACLDPSNARLPGTAWNHHTLCQQGLHSFCFTQAGLSSTGKPLSLKVLHVQQVQEAEFTLKTYALDHKIEIATVPSGCQLRYPEEWSIVTVALKDLDDLDICPGGPQREKYPDVQLERGYVDPAGVWRHNQCPIVQVGAWRCNFCARLASTLRIHRSRKEDCRELQRFRVPASCPSRPKVEALRKQWISCQRSNVRLRKAKERLTGELSSCRKKLEELSGNWLQKTLQEANLTEAQQRLVEECASAGQHKSKTGKKYDNNWLLLSLLLNIRTSTECEKKE